MKKSIKLKSIAVAALSVLAVQAYAAPITISSGETYSFGGHNYSYTGVGTVDLSEDVMGVFDLAHVEVSTSGPASYTPPSASVPVAGLYLDSDARQMSGLGTIGGAVLTIPKSGVSKLGGNVVLSNITFDLNSKTVFADLTGTNGAGTILHMAAFTAGSITGETSFTDHSFVTTASNWAPTQQALTFLNQAMALNKVGQSAIAALTDFGSANINITVTKLPDTVVPSVPEPTTYAMTLLGLIAVGAVRRSQLRGKNV